MADITNVTSSNFWNDVEKEERPVVVNFWAPWCKYSARFEPIFEAVSETLEDSCRCVKINVEESRDLAEKYAIMSLPTVMLVKSGREVTRVPGALSKQQLLSEIEPHI